MYEFDKWLDLIRCEASDGEGTKLSHYVTDQELLRKGFIIGWYVSCIHVIRRVIGMTSRYITRSYTHKRSYLNRGLFLTNDLPFFFFFFFASFVYFLLCLSSFFFYSGDDDDDGGDFRREIDQSHVIPIVRGTGQGKRDSHGRKERERWSGKGVTTLQYSTCARVQRSKRPVNTKVSLFFSGTLGLKGQLVMREVSVKGCCY